MEFLPSPRSVRFHLARIFTNRFRSPRPTHLLLRRPQSCRRHAAATGGSPHSSGAAPHSSTAPLPTHPSNAAAAGAAAHSILRRRVSLADGAPHLSGADSHPPLRCRTAPHPTPPTAGRRSWQSRLARLQLGLGGAGLDFTLAI